MKNTWIQRMIRQVQYEFICMNTAEKIWYMLGYIALAVYVIIKGSFLETRVINPWLWAIAFSGVSGKYNFGGDMFQMLPFSQKEYRRMLVFEKLPYQIFLAVVGVVLAFPGAVIHKNFAMLLMVFAYIFFISSWSLGLESGSFIAKEKKNRTKWTNYGLVMIGNISFAALFSIEDLNIYMRAFSISLWCIFYLIVSGMIRKHWFNKVCNTE